MANEALEQESARMRPYYKIAEDYPSLLIDDTHALCDRQDFEAMLEYSVTYPSGMYLGKVWKCCELRLALENGGPTYIWLLGEYVPHDEPDLIGVRWRTLEVVE